VPPLLTLTCIGERRGELWAKDVIDRVRCYWEHPWETYWELREYHREPIENMWE
jgi:hypothetical protein